jgi:murein DD-endopeptidase MepM/ murein hydrolase activator NlpD
VREQKEIEVMTKTLLLWLAYVSCHFFAASRGSAEQAGPTEALVRVIDMNVGESQTVQLCNGKEVSVKLIDLQERRDPIRDAVREARVMIEVDGLPAELISATYQLPKHVGDVQIDCSITKGYNSNGTPESWALDKDARLRVWPADSPLMQPGTFVYPVKQRWFASLTQMCNEPTYVDGCERPSRKEIYYHNGLDIGGCEALTEVVAATDGLIVSSGLEVHPEHRDNTPVRPRYDVVYLRDARGWYYRYSHLHKIDDTIKPGRVMKMGDRIGLLGKEGGSGGWTHLHFGISALQPSGRWGEQEGYAFLWEANLRQNKPKVIAVARPHHLILAGQEATLDASKSWCEVGKFAKFEWQFDDGSTAAGAQCTRMYPKPGCYSEVLKVTDMEGHSAYDFAIVQVIDRDQPERLPPMVHPTYAPTQGIRSGDPITFKVRTFGTPDGKEVWDFGDGSATVEVQSDGNVEQLNPNGYAVTMHSFQSPGDYIVRVQRTNLHGIRGIGHLHVHVE